MEDKNIIALFWSRSEEAIKETSIKYGPFLYVVSHNILKSKEDSQECLNDTYLKAWKEIPPSRPRYLKAYLTKIIRNISIDLYRKKKSQKRGSGQVELVLDELNQIAMEKNLVEKTIEGKFLVEKINKFLEEIDPDKRKIFLMRYFYLLPIKEIAHLLNRKESTINTILFRCREDLKKYLEKEEIIYSIRNFERRVL